MQVAGALAKCVSEGFKAETPLGRTGVRIRGQKGIATLGLERKTIWALWTIVGKCGQLWTSVDKCGNIGKLL